mmetsp:Transcript_133001/g.234376  ORF Transcript_133001/g.234376 Transcript_133001/m.234376 type:complete len:439 (+) Transcript_133001:3-1319(+)
MADQPAAKEAPVATGDNGGDSSDENYELTVFGKGAIAVGCLAILLELAAASGMKLQNWNADAELWRSFVWRFTFGLVCLRVWVFIASKIGARVAATSTSLAADFIMRPCGTDSSVMRAKSVARRLHSQETPSGVSWNIEEELLEMLQEEADGFSGYVWILAVAWGAAMWSGLPFIQTFVRFPQAVLAWATWRFAVLVFRSLDIVNKKVKAQDRFVIDRGAVDGLRRFSKVFIALLCVLFVMDNFGLDVSAAWAGLGITGILVGLSSQTVLTDIFAWLFLITQKPFITGDFVTVSGCTGVVEKINFLTTAIRTPPGELVIMHNHIIKDAQIVNLQSMPNRRYDLEFEVSALCSADLLAEIPTLVQEAVEEQTNCSYANCWLECLVPFGFKFVCQFWAEIPDIQEARTASTEIWLRMLRSFKEKGIVLASADRLQRGLVQ